MKRIPIILAAALGCVASAWGRVNITWETGWGAYTHAATNLVGESDRLLDSYSATWQLVWTGADGEIDPPDLNNATNGFVRDDDEVWAQRAIPMGGGAATDGTVWDGYMYWAGGNSPIYEDLSWSTPGFVYMRVYEGPPSIASWYYDSPPLELNVNYDPMIPFTQEFLLGTWEMGFKPDRLIPLADGAYLNITNANATVAVATSNLTVGGVSSNLSGTLAWTNSLGGSGLLAAAPSWSFTSPLHFGTNVITARGTNQLGDVASDTVQVVRSAALGPALHFVLDGSTNLLFGIPAGYTLHAVEGTDLKLKERGYAWSNLSEGVHYTTSGSNLTIQPAGIRQLIRMRLIFP